MSNAIRSVGRRLAVATLIITVTAATALHVAAQRGGSPLRIAVVDSLPVRDARALVMREGAGAQPITIFLTPASANVEILGGALTIARRLRAKPLAAHRTELIPVSGVVQRGTLGATAEARLVGMLRRLESQPVAQIGNLGRGRWIEVASQ